MPSGIFKSLIGHAIRARIIWAASHPRQGWPLLYKEAIGKAIYDLMAKDDRVIVLGEGVADPKHLFSTTALAHEHFPERVLETPLSETMLTGALAGLALEGFKPIYCHARAEFGLLGMGHIAGTLAKWSFLHNGQKLPILIRMMVGRGWGQGPQHSQAFHGMFTQIPGLRVWYPVQSGHIQHWLPDFVEKGPTLMLEPRRVYDCGPFNFSIPNVPPEVILLTVGDIAIDAIDAQQVLISMGVRAAVMVREGLHLDVWAPAPADRVPLVICDSTSWHYATFLSGLFDAPTEIVAPPNTPCPTAPDLEAAWYPTAEDIVNAALRLLGRPEWVSEQREARAPDMNRVTQPF